MAFGVETIGIHDFRPLGNGKVSVTLNNGNIGAFVTDEATAEKLKEKYLNELNNLEKTPNADEFVHNNAGDNKKSNNKAGGVLAALAGGAVVNNILYHKFNKSIAKTSDKWQKLFEKYGTNPKLGSFLEKLQHTNLKGGKIFKGINIALDVAMGLALIMLISNAKKNKKS